jgi:hypothetical protein
LTPSLRTLAIAGALLAACIHDDYECATDADCDVGVAGRCEVDHHCTQYDASCGLTLRRYTEHSGAESNVCYLGQIELADPCAAGQPPASPSDPCGALVCSTLPTCCNAGWSEPCVLEAQRSCHVTCDTRVAISATRGATLEFWDVRYDGSAFTATSVTDRTQQLDWIAPAPGSDEPRLAGFVGSDMLAMVSSAGEVDVPVDPTRVFHDVSSVDLDRDMRDAIALEWQDAAGDEEIQILHLDDLTSRDFDTTVSNRGVWGDYDQDGYPDGVSGTGSRYSFMVNVDAADGTHDRSLDASITASFNGSAHSGITSLRGFEWRDADHDGVLDLAAFGNSIRLHEGGSLLDDTPYLSIDCEPPVVLPNTTCDESLANFVGTVVPTSTGSIIYAGNTQAHTFYSIVPNGDAGTAEIMPLAIPTGIGSAAVAQAIFARDIDGDHVLDIVVIDSELGFWVSLSSADPTRTKFTAVHPIPSAGQIFGQVHASVTGAVQ